MKSKKPRGRFLPNKSGKRPYVMIILVGVGVILVLAAMLLALTGRNADTGDADPTEGREIQTVPSTGDWTDVDQTRPSQQPEETAPLESDPMDESVPDGTTTMEPTQTGTSSGSQGGSQQATPPKQNTTTSNRIEDGKLSFDEFGSYTGQFVEDGRDELVEGVAAVRVTNRSEYFLDFATITFSVDGNDATFVVSGLPAGRSAWVLEATGMTVSQMADFVYIDSVSSFREGVVAKSDNLNVTANGNMLTVTNSGTETLESIFVYYRTIHTDGHFLGGITYRVAVGTLAPGASAEVLAGHYTDANSEIIRLDWVVQGANS